MKQIEVLYGQGTLSCEIDERNFHDSLEQTDVAATDERATVTRALRHPIGAPTLHELTRDAKTVVLVTSDNTRPQPSSITIPLILAEFARPLDSYDITILIATGLHREMTKDEIIERFGQELYDRYPIVNHVALDDSAMVHLGTMKTGNDVYVNRLVTQCDLLLTEGFIEPHFFAGFSGGRKAILPGVCSYKTILKNHKPENVAHPNAKAGVLAGNPIHEECLEAAQLAGVDFTLNVCLNKHKQIIAAFAGDLKEAHEKGCAYVHELMLCKTTPCDIIITSNNGYPLDRNLYQAIKGVDTAALAVRKGGVIIIASECRNGVEHMHFLNIAKEHRSKEEFIARVADGDIAKIDQWQDQVLAKALAHADVILVSDGVSDDDARAMFLTPAHSLDEALAIAYERVGRDAKVSVMAEGPVVIPVVQ